jgi:predicted ATP-grasp superfamily ATP-dependent carboligase
MMVFLSFPLWVNFAQKTKKGEFIMDNQKLIKIVNVTSEGEKLSFTLDISQVNYDNLKLIEGKEKTGNRTVLYSKFQEKGITFQVTAWINSAEMQRLHEIEVTQQFKATMEENKRLLEELKALKESKKA